MPFVPLDGELSRRRGPRTTDFHFSKLFRHVFAFATFVVPLCPHFHVNSPLPAQTRTSSRTPAEPSIGIFVFVGTGIDLGGESFLAPSQLALPPRDAFRTFGDVEAAARDPPLRSPYQLAPARRLLLRPCPSRALHRCR